MFIFYFIFLIPIKNQPLSSFLLSLLKEVLDSVISQEKDVKAINTGNKTLFTDDMIVSAESSEEYTRKPNRTSK